MGAFGPLILCSCGADCDFGPADCSGRVGPIADQTSPEDDRRWIHACQAHEDRVPPEDVISLPKSAK